MIKQNEIEAVLKRLGRYSSTIATAYIFNRGVVAEDGNNTHIIEQLTKDRMIWRPDDTGEAHLTNDLTKLLDRALIRANRRHVHVDIGTRLSEIEDILYLYRRAKKISSLEDIERLGKVLQEQVYDLADNIISATNLFRSKVVDGFSEVVDLELRMTENEKTIERASNLNDALALLSIDQLLELAGSDIFLTRLFCQVLPKTIHSCREELVASLHMLTAMLYTLKKQHARHKLVESALKRYNSVPGYISNALEHCSFIPPDANFTSPKQILAYPDIYSSYQMLHLSHLLKGIRLNPEEDVAQPETDILIFADDQTSVALVEVAPILSDFFTLLQNADGSSQAQSAREHYEITDRGYSLEIWLMAVINGFYSLGESDKQKYSMSLVEERIPFYNGNYLVNDVVIERLNESQ